MPQKFGSFDVCERSKSADFSSLLCLADAFKCWQMSQVEDIFRFEKFLPHGRDEIGTTRKNANAVGIFCQVSGSFIQSTWAQQFKLWKTQSSPPASAATSRRDGSSGCRLGPLPRNQSAPPCSRK